LSDRCAFAARSRSGMSLVLAVGALLLLLVAVHEKGVAATEFCPAEVQQVSPIGVETGSPALTYVYELNALRLGCGPYTARSAVTLPKRMLFFRFANFGSLTKGADRYGERRARWFRTWRPRRLKCAFGAGPCGEHLVVGDPFARHSSRLRPRGWRLAVPASGPSAQALTGQDSRRRPICLDGRSRAIGIGYNAHGSGSVLLPSPERLTTCSRNSF
jgi:hypothetical protein